jgi:hypothetical protein
VTGTPPPANLHARIYRAVYTSPAGAATEAVLAEVEPELAAARAAGMRDAAAMLRRYCPAHGDADTSFMACHCPAAHEIDRDADTAARATTS